MSDSLSDYISTRDASELMGVDRTHINRLRIEGRISGKKIGREWLIFRPSLLNYLETKGHRGRPPAGKPKLAAASK